MSQWKCVYCDKEVAEKEGCNCEESKELWRYITTNTIKTEKGHLCSCGNSSFATTCYLDFTDSYSHTYKCKKCGNCIGLHCQRKDTWW